MTEAEPAAAADAGRRMLRHTLATLAYRGAKALRNAPDGFGDFEPPGGGRTPGRILAHVSDLMDWGLALARGQHVWSDSPALPWSAGVERFFSSLAAFDAYLASDGPLGFSAEQLFQGPVADALTHVGQIALLRRMAGGPIRGENYFKAEIEGGRVGRDQPAPRREFD